MQCLRCSHTLTEMTNAGVKIDVCYGGCGGIWFDQYEFKKLDEAHESDPGFLQDLAGSISNAPGSERRLECPVCDDFVMMRHFFSSLKNVELDECGGCAGIWLDGGELFTIYNTCPSDEDKKAAFDNLYQSEFAPIIEKMKQESLEDLEKAKKFKKAFKFICPSTYFGDEE